MHTIASGVRLAHTAGREPVVVWHKNPELGANFSDLFFTAGLPFELKEPGLTEFSLCFEFPRLRNFFVSFPYNLLKNRRNLLFETRVDEENLKIALDSDSDVIISSGLVLHEFDGDDVNNIFKLLPSVNSRIEKLLSGKVPAVGIQIRRTDNRLSIEKSPLELFEEKIREEIEKESEVLMFLATDSQQVKAELNAKYPGHLIFNPAIASRETLEGIMDGLAEMYILARCKKIYGSYWSSYSEVAALIGDCHLEVVYRGN